MEESDITYDDHETLSKLLFGKQVVAIEKTTGAAIFAEEHRRKLAEWKLGGNAGAKPSKYYYYSEGRGQYDDVLLYRLSGGITLRAHAHDGGCGCSNGCFSVEISEEDQARLIGATILSVQIEEIEQEYAVLEPGDAEYGETEPIKSTGQRWGYRPQAGSRRINGGEREDGKDEAQEQARITVFVYTDLASTQPVTGADPARIPLVTSEGGDNGYYGWGFHFSVDRTITVEEGKPNSVLEMLIRNEGTPSGQEDEEAGR